MAHDVAYSIVELTRCMEKSDEVNRSCIIRINFCNIIERSITVRGNKTGVIVKYETLEFKCCTMEEYTEVLSYLLKNIDESCISELNYRMEWENYFPDNDIDYTDELNVTVTSQNSVIFNKTVNGEFINALDFLTPLFFINE
jgi:hypothetical protein